MATRRKSSRALYQSKKVVCYCTVGGRSGVYTEKLRRKGMDAVNLKGSVLAWANAGKEFVDSKGSETRAVHVSGAKWNVLPHAYSGIW